MILREPVHHAEAAPDRDQILVEAIADRAFHDFPLGLGIGVAHEDGVRDGVALTVRREARLDVRFRIDFPVTLEGVEPGIDRDRLEVLLAGQPHGSRFHAEARHCDLGEAAPRRKIGELVLLVFLGQRYFLFGEARIPIFALVEEGLARPDLLHDGEALAHHVVEMLGIDIVTPDAVHVGRCGVGTRADAEEVATLENLRKPSDRHCELGGMLMGEKMRHRRELDRLRLERGRRHDQLGIGNVLPDLRGVLGDHHRGEAGLVGRDRTLDTPFERLTSRATRTHIGVKDESCFHCHGVSPGPRRVAPLIFWPDPVGGRPLRHALTHFLSQPLNGAWSMGVKCR